MLHAIALVAELSHHLRLSALELLAQQLAEQIVIAYHLPRLFSGTTNPLCIERLERVCRLRGLEHCVAEPAAMRSSTEVYLQKRPPPCEPESSSTRGTQRQASSPANARARRARAPACNASAARYKPQTSPPVCSVSSASSVSSRCTPAAASSNRLLLVEPRSATPISRTNARAATAQASAVHARDRDLRARRGTPTEPHVQADYCDRVRSSSTSTSVARAPPTRSHRALASTNRSLPPHSA